jgi:hypothetical protein
VPGIPYTKFIITRDEGYAVGLDTTNEHGQTMAFYWADPGAYTVSVAVTLADGRQGTKTAKYDIQSPQVRLVLSTLTPIRSFLQPSNTKWMLAIKLIGEFTAPGKLLWLQTTHMCDTVYFAVDPGDLASPDCGPGTYILQGDGLDYADGDMPKFDNPFEDIPKMVLPWSVAGDDGYLNVSDNFVTYQMWQSDRALSQPVPFNRCEWGYSYSAPARFGYPLSTSLMQSNIVAPPTWYWDKAENSQEWASLHPSINYPEWHEYIAPPFCWSPCPT